jgi:hypothetical protein
MKIIYKANDGTEFTKRDKFEQHEMETVENKYKDFSKAFVRYGLNDKVIPYIFKNSKGCILNWKYAKSI